MFDSFRNKMREKGVSELAIKIFEFNFNKFIKNSSALFHSSEINPLNKTDAVLTNIDYSQKNLQNIDTKANKIAVIKLNGGLGTSMGLKGPKSQLIVKNNLNFIEITVSQIRKFNENNKSNVPLIFMNSFNTHEATEESLQKLKFENLNLPHSFNENKSPKISVHLDSKTFTPASFPADQSLEWAPPGHADVYPALFESGLLDELTNKGYEYIFISNVDNLGATLNPEIIDAIFKLDSSFVMEVATRTENDKKGGHLALKNDKLILRESSQVTAEDKKDFQDFHKYKFFNTNSIWIKIKSLKDLMLKNKGILDLPIIINKKNIDPTDLKSEKIIQLESAMGSAISLFEDAKTILIPNERFVPVKNTSNLLYLLSDLVKIDENFVLHPLKNIYIDLKNSNYKMIDDFNERFKVIPSLKNCESLVIENDIKFDKNIELSGNVKL